MKKPEVGPRERSKIQGCVTIEAPVEKREETAVMQQNDGV